jgi:putative flippase GtrA
MLPIQFIKYGIVGTISTAIHFLVASLFVYFVTPSLLFSNMLGFAVAFIWSFFVQSKVVFQSSPSAQKGLKFFLVQVAALIIAVGLADTFEAVSIYLKIFLVSVFLPVTAFFIHKFWTFVEK